MEKPIRELQNELAAEKRIVIKEKELKDIGGEQGDYEKSKQLREKINGLLAQRNSLEKELARLEAKMEFRERAGGRAFGDGIKIASRRIFERRRAFA